MMATILQTIPKRQWITIGVIGAFVMVAIVVFLRRPKTTDQGNSQTQGQPTYLSAGPTITNLTIDLSSADGQAPPLPPTPPVPGGIHPVPISPAPPGATLGPPGGIHPVPISPAPPGGPHPVPISPVPPGGTTGPHPVPISPVPPVPSPSTPPGAPAGGRFRPYVVQPGDTLSGIAAAFGTIWQSIFNLNAGTITSVSQAHGNPVPGGPQNNIFPGEVLQVPY